MNKQFLKNIISLLVVCGVIMVCTSCSDDDNGQPRIDSVWMNMLSQPIAETTFAYPGQTICLHGTGFGALKQVIVNGTEINLNTLFVLETSNYITFKLPSDVSTEGDYITVVTGSGEATIPFIVRPTSEKPTITAFSSTTLIGGRTLTITGTNLDGATRVWLPLAFGEKVECELSETTSTSVTVIIPEDADFATGCCEIMMEKYDETRDINYIETVYSTSTNFNN